jgi:hypothetical protein
MGGKNIKQDIMADWDKLNKELDSALDSMTPEEWIKWKNKNGC